MFDLFCEFNTEMFDRYGCFSFRLKLFLSQIKQMQYFSTPAGFAC